MIDKNTKTQEAVKKTANSIRTAFFLLLLTNVYGMYRFINIHGGSRQGIAIALDILMMALVWQLSRQLRAEKKQALYYWLAIALLGYSRWIFIDDTFHLNVFSIVLFSLAFALTARIINWTRSGVLA